MADGLGYRRWMYSENGATFIVLRDEKPHPDAVEVPDEWINEAAREPQSFRLRPRRDDPRRMEVARARRARLSLSANNFDADGVDFVEFMVIVPEMHRARHLPIPEQIEFTLNGQPFTVAPNTPWPLSSQTPGLFIFRLTDDRLWANPDERRAIAR
jgi:hypothetical protein